MKCPPGASILLLTALLFSSCTSEPEFVPLFNGGDLTGWVNVNTAPSTWAARDGMIVCSGRPHGVMCTDRHYENFVLELEWRHMTEGGNAGLFVHSDPVPARGVPFTRSIEVQILDGNHGDVFSIHGATMVPDRPHPRGWMRSLPTEERANPYGEWNHYRVESRDGRLTLAVNGGVVSGGTELNPRRGYICLESEGGEVHFRNIRIMELPSTNPSPDETAGLHEGYVSLYTGVDLSGWRDEGGAVWRPNDWILTNDGAADGEEMAADGAPPAGEAQAVAPALAPEAHLWTERAYGNFTLIADWRMACAENEAARSGIFLRGSTDAFVHLGCSSAAFAGTTADVLTRDGERRWRRLVVSVEGMRLRAEVDDEIITEEALPDGFPASGSIGLAHFGAPVEFANLFVKELE